MVEIKETLEVVRAMNKDLALGVAICALRARELMDSAATRADLQKLNQKIEARLADFEAIIQSLKEAWAADEEPAKASSNEEPERRLTYENPQ